MTNLVAVTFQHGQSPRLKFARAPKGGLDATPAGDIQTALPGSVEVEYLVSVDGDGDGGTIVGAHLLSRGSGQAKQPELLLTHLRPAAGAATPGGAKATPGAATSQSADLSTSRPVSAILLADSAYAYVGQPYTVGPDGHVFQPVANEAGYSIMVHSFPEAAASSTTGQGGSR
jgi:hypothetical protein